MKWRFDKKVIIKSQRQFMYGSNFYGSDVTCTIWNFSKMQWSISCHSMMLMFSIFTYTFYNTVHCISEEKYDQNPTDNASNTKDQSQNWKREKNCDRTIRVDQSYIHIISIIIQGTFQNTNIMKLSPWWTLIDLLNRLDSKQTVSHLVEPNHVF